MEFKDVRQVEWDDATEAIEKCYALGWTDGLPVVPPNATIGRAIRLILMNACASIPGLFDRSMLGESAKYSYCIAENETETHWLPLHVERGFDRAQSTVTVFACWSPRQLRCDADPLATLDCAADVASTFGTSLCTADSVADTSLGVRQGQMALTVAGASTFWRDWSKQDVREYLHWQLRVVQRV